MGGSAAGKNVNERSAMQMTAVYACARILSEAIAGLPLHMYQYLGDDCAWSGDEGATIAAKNNCLLYVGPWTKFNIWTSTSKKMFNYAIPKEI